MKTVLIIFSFIILSCNSQKKVVEEKNEVNKTTTEIEENVNDVVEETIEKVEIDKKNNSTNSNTVNKNLEITLLNEGTHGGFDDAKTLVIKDLKGLQGIYAKINMTRRPGFPIPEIDFEKEMVIALFLGEKTSGGYTAKVETVIEKDNMLEISVNESSPEGMATTVICQPFYFCKVNRSDKEVVFKKVD